MQCPIFLFFDLFYYLTHCCSDSIPYILGETEEKLKTCQYSDCNCRQLRINNGPSIIYNIESYKNSFVNAWLQTSSSTEQICLGEELDSVPIFHPNDRVGRYEQPVLPGGTRPIYTTQERLLSNHTPIQTNVAAGVPPEEYEMSPMEVSYNCSMFPPMETELLLEQQNTQPEYHSLNRRPVPKQPLADAASVSAPATPQAALTRRRTTQDGRPVQRHHSETITAEASVPFMLVKSISVPDGSTEKLRVFITFAKDNKDHVEEVLRLADFLKRHNLKVAIDMAEQEKIARDKMGWIERRFRGADKVIAVISPEYWRVIGGNKISWDNMSPRDAFSPHGLNTRYIHRLMQTEYLGKRCANKRFMPVVFPKSGAQTQHVPEWLNNTLVYTWPRNAKALVMHTKDCYWYDEILDSGT